jgi:hypothetical protein
MNQMNKRDGFNQPGRSRNGRDILGQPREASLIGEVVTEYITRNVGPRQSYFSAVAGVWEELIPAELQAHCSLKDFSRGRLVVKVDSPVYLYELQLRRKELLREIRRRLRGAERRWVGGETDIAQAGREQPIRGLKFTAG